LSYSNLKEIIMIIVAYEDEISAVGAIEIG
jgi:hypothetical protein